MKTIIGVMGPGEEATDMDIENAHKIGELIAENGWVLLSGGRKEGVMGAVNKGAKEKGGLTLGVLPSDDKSTFSEDLEIAVITNMKSARNYINVISSDVVIACGMGAGTASEVALALKADKPVILISDDEESKAFFKKIGGNKVYIANSPKEAIEITKKLL